MHQLNTPDYFDEIKEQLYSAVISDVLDSLGYRNQTMEPRLRPVEPSMVLVGRAKTVLAAEVYRIPDKPYEKQIAALDSIKPGEVFVAALNGSKSSAFFGELMATAIRAAGGRGAVIDGLSRDTKKIVGMGFPVFVAGFRPTDSLGRIEVIESDTPIICAGVWVHPGDLIFGDIDGIVVVPQSIEEQVIAKAKEKVKGENLVRDLLQQGVKISVAFERYGIL
jgi:4-hydroxy-4-methyl-2-oxoglutarate aldolase